jgi:hypothetical protein
VSEETALIGKFKTLSRTAIYFAFFFVTITTNIEHVHAANDWPNPPVRSGTTLPQEWRISALFEAGGLYLPASSSSGGVDKGLIGGTLGWNLRLIGGLGLFGKHNVERLFWDNYAMLAFGHEVGARFITCPHFTLEAAYLGHRGEREWIDGEPWALGGVYDHGVEVGAWGRIDPVKRFRIEAHLLGRYFGEPDPDLDDPAEKHHYADEHWVLGLGLRISIMPFDGHAISLDLETLRVYRAGRLRNNVNEVDWNVIGRVLWRSNFTKRFGIEVGAQMSTKLFVGWKPMFETKRSLIDQPVAAILAGFFFFI